MIRHPDRLEILVAGPVDADVLQSRLTQALGAAGAAALPINMKRVAAIPRTALGKAPLVRTAGQLTI